MDYKLVFDALKDINKLRNQTPVEEGYYDEYDTYGDRYEVYQVEDIYIRVNSYRDSYGDDQGVTGIEIVEPKKVQVTNFEPVI